jgi:hypothetical protein
MITNSLVLHLGLISINLLPSLLHLNGKLKRAQFVSRLAMQLDYIESPLVILSMQEVLEGHL